MTHACSCGHESTTIDVRQLPPRVRHPRILATFDALPAGHAFEVVCDHDPKALSIQFETERSGAFGWRYLEQGPALWRVEIWKRPALVHRSHTIAQVSRDPRALQVLEARGIRERCAGHLTLAEAAAALGLPLDDLIRSLETAMTGVPA